MVRVSKKGGRSTELAEGLGDSPTSIFVVSDRLYLVTDDPQGAGSALSWIPKIGRPKPPSDSVYVGVGNVVWGDVAHAASDGVAVFWTTARGDSEHPEVRLLRRANGSNVNTELAHGAIASPIAAFGSRVYWVTPSGIESVDKTRAGPVAVDPNP